MLYSGPPLSSGEAARTPLYNSKQGMGRSCFEEYKPALAMVVVQCIYAAMALSAKAAFSEGMSPLVFVVYRQAIATVFLVPTTILARRGSVREMALGFKGFCLVFVTSLIGATLNQYLYYEGVNLTNPSMATAMTNLIPAITFVMAAFTGLEKLKRSMRSIAKVVGTIICIGGAFVMAFLKGPGILHSLHETLTSISLSVDSKWLIGCFMLIGSACCWSLWLILQVPICETYIDPLSLTVWMCFLATIQSAIITFFVEPNIKAWKITSVLELLCCLFAGIFGSGVTFYLQSWSIIKRGPLFSALFNPLNTIIATAVAIPLLHEELYIGSLIGAAAIVGGLYIVLWGKAEDLANTSLPNSRSNSLGSDGADVSESFLAENQMVRRHSSYSLI